MTFPTVSESFRQRPWGRMLIIFLALVLVMLATVRHSASVYLAIIPSSGIGALSDANTKWQYAYGVVSVLDLVVIIFTFAGSRLMPAAYALGVGILTLIYFNGTQTELAKGAAIAVFTVLLALSGFEFAELAHSIWTGKKRSDLLAFLRHHLRTNEATYLRQRLTQLEQENDTLRGQMARTETAAKNLLAEADRKVSETIGRLEEENRKALAAAEERLRKNVANAFMSKAQPSWLKEGGEA